MHIIPINLTSKVLEHSLSNLSPNKYPAPICLHIYIHMYIQSIKSKKNVPSRKVEKQWKWKAFHCRQNKSKVLPTLPAYIAKKFIYSAGMESKNNYIPTLYVCLRSFPSFLPRLPFTTCIFYAGLTYLTVSLSTTSRSDYVVCGLWLNLLLQPTSWRCATWKHIRCTRSRVDNMIVLW